MDDFDCRHFLGDKPCAFSRKRCCLSLTGEKGKCAHYEPLGPKILIIKLGALGDVLRTTTLLPALNKRFPGASVTWITKAGAGQLLENSGVQKVLPWDVDAVLYAKNQQWDVVISLDKEEGPTTLAQIVQGKYAYGFGRNRHGLLWPLSESTMELFRLGFDDHEKFNVNEKPYPRLIAEACELEWGPNPYVLNLRDAEIEWARDMSGSWGDGPAIGLNVGSGDAFAGKQWPFERLAELAGRLRQHGLVPVFLGGTAEKEDYQKLQEWVGSQGIFPGCEFHLRHFMALISRLTVMLSGDTLAMHMAIAQKIYSVALFGSTTEREIEFYGRGEALVGKVPCGPCYRRFCPTKEECLQEISVEQVLAAILRGVEAPRNLHTAA